MPNHRDLYEALRSAFTNFDEVRRLVYFELGDRLTNIPSNPSLDDGAFQVIQWADTRGNTGELIAALKKERPDNKFVQALAGPAPARFRHFTATLPKVDPYLTGRDPQLAFLDTAWTSGDNVVQIVASGGTGKTALMDHWFRRHLTEATVFGWSFYSQGTSEERSQTSSDPFFAEIFRWLNLPALEPTASPWTKAAVLAERLRTDRVLLLLDGLEPLQDAAGEMKDAAMKALLAELETENRGLAVCTTRVRITDVPGARVLELDNLSPEAGADYLVRLGVRGDPEELKQASADYGNHALALTLLGKYLVKFCAKDVRRSVEIPKVAIKQLGKPAEHASRMIAAYERTLKDTPELAILKGLGYFDRPAEKSALDLVLPKLDPLDYLAALDRLRELRLVLAEDGSGALDCHPLIREHFAEPASAEGHSELYEYYAKQAPHRPDKEEGMRPLFYAIYHGCRGGRHAEAFDSVYMDRVRRHNEAFLIHKLAALGTNLSLLANFFTTPWTAPVSTLSSNVQSWVIGEAGFALRALGRMADAVDPMREGAHRAMKEQNWKNAAIGFSNLSQLLLTLGHIQEAISAARQSVELADRSGDQFWEMVSRSAQADALHQSGDRSGSAMLFTEAEHRQVKRQPQFPFLYSLRGYQYCDLLLVDRNNTAEVRHRATQTLDWTNRHGPSFLDIALNQLTLARAGYPAYFTHVIDGLRRAGTLEFIPLGLLARGTQHDLDEVFKISRRSGMKLHLTDAHLAQAHLYLKEGRCDEARTHFNKAADLVTETGYHRRDPELAELRAALDG